MVAVEEGKEIEPIVREDLEAPVDVVDLFEIDQEPEQAIAKPVRLGCEPPMKDRTDIKARLEAGPARHAALSRAAGAARGVTQMRDDSPLTVQGRFTPPSSSATARPACSASSWKPEPKCAPQYQTLRTPCSRHSDFWAAIARVEQRMIIRNGLKHALLTRRARRVQGHEDVGLRRQALQPVHPVGDADALRRAGLAADIVPTRPHCAAARHQALVRMKDREIAAVAERAKQRALFPARLVDKGERLVGMAGEHDLIEPVAAPAAVNDDRSRSVTLDPDGARSVTDGARQRKAHAPHIFRGAPADGAPDRAPAELQEAVIVMETDESRRGKGHDLGRRGRPDRARHRKDMMVAKSLAVAARSQILAEAQMVLVDAAGVAGRTAVESRQGIPQNRG